MMLKVISLVSIVLLLSIFVGPIYAEVETRDMGSLTTDYGNGTFKFESMPMWINNSTDYVPYILTENATTYKIETQLETLVFNKLGCNAIFYNGTQVVLDSDSSIIHQKDLTTNSTWQYITDVNNAACTITIYEDSINNSITLESNKTSTNLATFSTKYIKNNDDNGFKLLLSVTNDNPSWTNNTMGFIETIHIPTNEVTLNGTVYNIPNNNGTFFDHNFFNNTQGSIIKLGDINYNYDTGLVNLWGATLIDDNGTSKITFDYSFNDNATAIGESYEIDPTFGFTSGIKRAVQTVFQTGAACGAPNVIGGSNDLVLAASADAFDCIRSSYTVDITSIPDSATIDSVSARLDIFTAPNARVCDFNDLNTFPRSSNPSVLWTDIGDGTTFLDASSVCLSTGVKTFDLGTAAATDVQTRLVGNEWGVGIKYDNEVRDGLGHVNRFNSMSYQIIYDTPPPPDTFPPNKPLNVAATQNRDGKILLTWDANNATNVEGYSIFSADKYNGPFTLLDTVGNVTSFRHTGLDDYFEQYYKISGFFNPNGTNSTIVYGTSGNPFVNDTDNSQTQILWLGDTTGFETLRMQQQGTGSTCNDPTGPNSVTQVGSGSGILLYDTADVRGCEFSAYVMDRSTTNQFLLPQFFEDTLSRIDYLLDIFSEGQTTAIWSCQYNSVSNAAFEGVDPRINLTLAYELIHDSARDREVADGYVRCAPNNEQLPELENGKGGNFGVTLYTDSMLLNSSFYSYSTYVNVENRPNPTADSVASFDSLMKMKFKNPTFSKVWSIQEHPKFDDESLVDGNFEIKNGKFTMDTITDDSQRGQVVLWKTLNKTQVGGIGFDTDGITTDIAQAELDAIFLSAQNTLPLDIYFSPNGTKMYMAGAASNEINEYTLTTAWIAAASFTQVISLSADVSGANGVVISSNGLKMYVSGVSDDQVHEYDLSNPFDISSAIFSQAFNLEIGTDTQGLFIDEDGTKLYIPNGLDQNITQYNFGTAFDVSTLSFNQFLDVSADIVNAKDVFFNPDGTLMFILEEDDGTDIFVNTYTLSIGFDISTASFLKRVDLSVIVLNNAEGLFFRNDGLKMYMMTDQAERLTQYDLAINGTGNSIDPNIRVTGSMKAETNTDDLHLRFEIKDGSYAMGNDDTSFPKNEFDTYNTGGSLGVVHLNPQSTSIESFDISMIPNWSNSTQDLFTIFIGIDDNSTSGSLAVNVTTVDIQNTLQQDFEDLEYLNYYEVSSSIDCIFGETSQAFGACLNARPFYNHGLVNPEQIFGPSPLAIPLPIPPTPTNVIAVNGSSDSRIDLTWKHSLLNATDFQISRETPIGNGFVKIDITNNMTLAYFDTGLNAGQEYNYEICALNGGSIETTCATASAFTSGLPFSAPQNLVATNDQLDQIDLTWDAENATGVTGYTIFNSSTGSSPFDILGDNSDNSTTFSDLGLPNNFDMFYKVSAFGVGGGNGTNSTVAFGSTIIHSPPQNLTATNNQLLQIDLTWDAINATDVVGYTVYNSSTGSSPFDILGDNSDNSTTFNDLGLPNNFDMFYKVSAFGKGNGTNSTVAFGSTTQPGQPVNIDNVNSTAILLIDVLLEWADSGINITDYKIDRNGTEIVASLLIEHGNITTKAFIDNSTSIGTNFIYNVSGVNAPNGSLTIVGNPTLSNVVKTNDIPSQVLNVVADLVNFFTLNQIELSWNQANNGSGSPLGVGVSLNETRIYAKNITDGGDFVLTVTLPSTSPPPTEYNDTNIIIPNDYSYLISSCNVLGCGPNSTEVFADSIDFPDAIFDLLFYDLTFQSLILNWTQPFLGGGSLQNGYQINFTTPHAEPLTIVLADTGSSFTEFTVSGLTELTNYTFRVSAINQAGLNATGLKLNITTLDDFTEENFTVGFIGEFPDSAIDETNLDIVPIRFERIDINDTTVMLNVTYANNIDLACSFDYKFAMTESFFDKPLDTVNIGGGDQETSFLFLDFDNEVVDVFCWNEVANQTATISGSYILVQQNFPLLDQIAAFRAGDFGTEGMFGILDMVTLMVIIISMIGFNRVNETVGAIFNIIFIGALAFFEIIELSTTIFAAVALVLMLVIISTRKV